MEKTMYQILKGNIGLREKEDGTQSGRFTALKKADFSSLETFDTYRKYIGFASQQIENSLHSDLTDEESARFVNLALAHVRDCYAIIREEIKADFTKAAKAEAEAEAEAAKAELEAAQAALNNAEEDKKAEAEAEAAAKAAKCALLIEAAQSGGRPIESINLNKKHIRAWIATGNFARVKTDYRSGVREIEMKSWIVLRRMIECDIADIINQRPRMEKVNANKSTLAMFAKVEKNASEAAAKAAKAAEREAAKAAKTEAEKTEAEKTEAK